MGFRAMRSRALFVAGTALACGLAAPAVPQGSGAAASAAGSAQRCAAMAQAAFGDDVRILSAAHVDAADAKPGGPGGFGATPALPSHCRVEGMIGERKGKGGKSRGNARTRGGGAPAGFGGGFPGGFPDLSALPPGLNELPPGLAGMDQLPPGFDVSKLKFDQKKDQRKKKGDGTR